MKFTAIIEKSDDGWFVGQLEEFPAVLSQGKTKDELIENLSEAFSLLIETNREITSANYSDRDVIREHIILK